MGLIFLTQTEMNQTATDEVLVPHDVIAGGGTLKNVFVDDKFGEMLSEIPAGEIFVFIDACHSGSATKGADLIKGKIPKFLFYEGMPKVKGNFAVEETSGKENYVCLSACRDDEQSLATPNGSLFTLAIFDAVKDASKSSKEITVSKIKETASDYISQNASPEDVHHPQISGSKDLAGKNLILVSAPSPGVPDISGQNWRNLRIMLHIK